MNRHPATIPEEELLTVCSFQTTRRSGPGGQHRNKVETAVVITHVPTGVRAEANERRSQTQNRGEAVFRLRVALAQEIRTAIEPTAAPSELWRSRVRGQKLSVSAEHADFPSLLAEALDRVAAHQADVAAAARTLNVSTTQLVRFLQQAPPAWQAINAQRKATGMRPLY